MADQEPPAARRVTISDVAALAGVSRGAVSQVFNGTGSISTETSARIREAARKLNWVPSSAAVALRQSRSLTIGLVLARPRPDDLGAANPLLISGIESVLSPRRYGLLLHLLDRDADEEARTYRALAAERRVDGVILTESLVRDRRLELTRSLGLPAVLLGPAWNDDPIPHIDAGPPGAGVDEAVHHLVSLGHRRIAYVGGRLDRMQAAARQETFESAMRAAGLLPFASVAGDYSAESGAAHTGRLLGANPRPTAIVFGADAMAIGGLAAARTRGIRVPEELSIVGFDGLAVGQWLEPALTTVQRDHVQRGRAVAALMLRHLGEDVDEEIILHRPYLVHRGSTAEAPAD